ncbi:MAG: type II toxin-antitoxin system HicA family toxin [Angustibacter sp.]
MKRRDLMKQLAKQAKAEGVELEVAEGGNHTRVKIGDRRSTVPRHSEVNELTAKAILRQMGVGR